MSLKSWEKLTPEQQGISFTAALINAELQRELWTERETASMEIVTTGGTVTNTIADKKRSKMQ